MYWDVVLIQDMISLLPYVELMFQTMFNYFLTKLDFYLKTRSRFQNNDILRPKKYDLIIDIFKRFRHRHFEPKHF